MTSNLIQLAKKFAINAHNSIGHKRKYTEEPYYFHLERVANIVASVTDSQNLIAAAWLHDILEDVSPKNFNYNAAAIETTFGKEILLLVTEVTDVSTLADGNRATRKNIDRLHLASASPEGKTIKLADLIDNYLDISANDPHFAKIFKKETQLLLPYLKEGNATLYKHLRDLISESS